jgi:hypothetical protein
VDTGGGRVARLAGVEDQDRAAGPGQGQRAAEPGGTAADHDHVEFVHAATVRSLRRD